MRCSLRRITPSLSEVCSNSGILGAAFNMAAGVTGGQQEAGGSPRRKRRRCAECGGMPPCLFSFCWPPRHCSEEQAHRRVPVLPWKSFFSTSAQLKGSMGLLTKRAAHSSVKLPCTIKKKDDHKNQDRRKFKNLLNKQERKEKGRRTVVQEGWHC